MKKDSQLIIAGMGRRIIKRRMELGLSREKLADIAEISVRFLYDIENDKKGMSFKTFYNIKTKLDCSADWLLDGK